MAKFTLDKKIKILLVSMMLLLSCGCALTPPKSNNVDAQIEAVLRDSIRNNERLAARSGKALPSTVNEALMPDLSLDEVARTTAKPKDKTFDITVNAVPAKQFFMGLIKNTSHNITVSPQVSGDISLDLKNVTIDDVLDTVKEVYGFEYQKNASGYQVFPRKLETKIFTLNYLDIDRIGKSTTSVSSGEITKTITGPSTFGGGVSSTQQNVVPITNIETASKVNFWSQLKETLSLIVGDKEGRSVVINPHAGLVVVRAYTDELRRVAQYLDSVQNVMARQVIIEAKILEVELNANYQSGIDWHLFGFHQKDLTFNDKLLKFADDTNPGMFAISISGGNAFDSVINLLNTQGRVHTLSSPRITTLNNQKAVIKVGQDEFFVTNVSSETVVGTTSTTGQNIELTPFFSGIALDVTPQIDEHGGIILHIHPLVSNVTTQVKNVTVANLTQTLPLAKSTIRESDDVVHAENGQVVIIGGLMENSSDLSQSGLPGLDKVRGMGGLFKKFNNVAKKFELVILLRPIIVENKTLNKELLKAARRIGGIPASFKYDLKPYPKMHK